MNSVLTARNCAGYRHVIERREHEPGQRQIAGFPRRRLMTIDDITGAALAVDDAQLA